MSFSFLMRMKKDNCLSAVNINVCNSGHQSEFEGNTAEHVYGSVKPLGGLVKALQELKTSF